MNSTKNRFKLIDTFINLIEQLCNWSKDGDKKR